MTNKEAIETLKKNYPDACYEQLREAVDTAISALQKQEVEIYWGYTPTCKRPLADNEIVSRLRDIKAQLGGSYAIDRAIEIIKAVAKQKENR